MALVRVRFWDTKSEEREGEKFEYFLDGLLGCDGGEEGVLFWGGGGVGGGLKGAKGSLNWFAV